MAPFVNIHTPEVFGLRVECILTGNAEQNPHNEHAKETSEVFEKSKKRATTAICSDSTLLRPCLSSAARLSC